MAGIDDRVAVIGDWVPPSSSPRTFFSSILSDDFNPKSFPPILGDDEREDPFAGSTDKLKMPTTVEERTENSIPGEHISDLSILSSQKSSCLADRVAARAGFNAPKLNTTKIGPANLSLPGVRSPYLMISPGLSPTVLLDSPVFLSNSMAQPSPTTGKFVTVCGNNQRSMAFTKTPDRDKDDLFEDIDTLSFAFKPHVESSSSYVQSATNEETPAINPKQFPTSIEVSVQSKQSLQLQNSEVAEAQGQINKGFHFFEDFSVSSMERNNDTSLEQRAFDNAIAKAENSTPLDDQQDDEGDQRSTGEMNSTVVDGAPSEDGYNWRKYGQKQVKGSECPRSYYKCTHPNCQVKKKVERSQEGHIREIIYKGGHNHPKPPPNRRLTVGSSNLQNDSQLDILEHTSAQTFADVDPSWENSQRGPANGAPNWIHDNLDATSPASESPESCDPSNSMLPLKGPHAETAASGVDVSMTLSNEDDEEDLGANGSVSVVYDGQEDESESKRRRIDAIEMGGGGSRAIREPRVVVQTTSEVDILDDGYRWRKYGQKVVKGNPNPRSYYKCTYAGCTVRKHVERASHDLKSVITTYEGKHNHDVPAARNNSQASSGPSTMVQQSSASQTRIHRPEPSQVQDSMGRFDGPALLGKLSLHGRQQLGQTPSFSFRVNQPGLANLTMASLGTQQGKMPGLPINQYLGQQHQVNEMGFITLKGEPKSETGLNLSNGPPSLWGPDHE